METIKTCGSRPLDPPETQRGTWDVSNDYLRNCVSVLLAAFLVVSILASTSFAADYPHNSANGVDCFSCHTWPFNPTDELCLACHDGGVATSAVSHSSDSTSTKYGDWAMPCISCHQQHDQDQYRAYGGESLVVFGTSDSAGITANTLTMSNAGWTVDSFAGMVLFPNLNNDDYSYKIIGNTADTITVKGSIDLYQVTDGNTDFGIIYGKLIRGAIITPSSGEREVRLFKGSGTNSFADGDAVYDGVCEVCHTQTSHHQNNGLAIQQSHYDGARCTSCHTHDNGFGGLDHTVAGFVLPVDMCLGCHVPTSSDLVAGIHGNQCGLCHTDPLGAGPLIEPYETASPNGGTCTDCHNFNEVHGNVNHTATPGNGAVAIFADRTHDDAAWAYGQPGPHFDILVDCDLCHTTDLPAAHGNNCATCHPTPYNTLSTWNGGCQQGGCHAVYHGDITSSHDPFEDSYDYANNDCNRCHEATSWAVPQSNCLNCHASYGPEDHTPPITSTNTLAEYNGPCRIVFSIQDNGKVGIGRTFYKLDNGTVTAGSQLYVTDPGAHTLEFWSIDQAGNVESPHKNVYFTNNEDTTPPTTTSNALPSYNKGTVITLAATDAGTLGVKNTFYSLNGGATQTGTKVSIPGAIGTTTYTLRFWSEDFSGNIEAQNSVSFTVNVPANGTIRLVWWDADINPSHAPTAGEWANWTIKRGTTVVSKGSKVGPWNGVNNITVPVSATPYTVSISYGWWEEDYLEEDQTIFSNRYMTTSGQIIKLNY